MNSKSSENAYLILTGTATSSEVVRCGSLKTLWEFYRCAYITLVFILFLLKQLHSPRSSFGWIKCKIHHSDRDSSPVLSKEVT